MRIEINERISVAGAPTHPDLAELLDLDVTTLIDLRADDEETEDPAILSPDCERCYADALGFSYYQIPITAKLLHRSTLRRLRDAIMRTERKVLVHCCDGARAGWVALMCLACAGDLSLPDVFGRVRKYGFDNVRTAAIGASCVEEMVWARRPGVGRDYSRLRRARTGRLARAHLGAGR